MPERGRVLRRERRRAWRGHPTGRRATHLVETTYGRKQKARDWDAEWRAAITTTTAGEAGGKVTGADEWAGEAPNPMFDPWEPEQPAGPLCDKDGIDYDTYGGELEWQCGRQGTVSVPSGRLLCEDHAGELGYGPKQEEYGFDPDDGFNPTPGTATKAGEPT